MCAIFPCDGENHEDVCVPDMITMFPFVATLASKNKKEERCVLLLITTEHGGDSGEHPSQSESRMHAHLCLVCHLAASDPAMMT